MQYLARECGYAEPVPIEPESAEAELQRRFIAAVEGLQGIQAQLQRVQLLRKVS